jgi:hypothetical protein
VIKRKSILKREERKLKGVVLTVKERGGELMVRKDYRHRDDENMKRQMETKKRRN